MHEVLGGQVGPLKALFWRCYECIILDYGMVTVEDWGGGYLPWWYFWSELFRRWSIPALAGMHHGCTKIRQPLWFGLWLKTNWQMMSWQKRV